ncbi:ribose transport system permease protein [Vreelandella arcis]|uniref:Ribose transport system permease protein n=2 Tax=Vreelandella arcis TaxID=416873 RepID=A0A1H0HG30_9GAMM|nr:ribose transport system permease protein [Halomonas arcis]
MNMSGENNMNAKIRSAGDVFDKVNPLIIVIAILYVGISLISDRFLDIENQMNILRQVAVYLVIALGMTFVIASRGIDLSVGSNLGLCAMVLGTLIDSGIPVPFSIFLVILLGALIGAFNGLVITRLRINPLIVTLGMLVALRGATHFLMGSAIIRMPESLKFIGQGFVGVVPVPAIIALSATLCAYWLFFHTRFGRHTVSIGSNEDACQVLGIHVSRHKVAVYAFQGACVGLAAAILVGRLNAASPSLGNLYELHIIAAVVLGGTALYGGVGTVFGTLLGILTIGILENGMVLIGADFHLQRVLLGFLLIFAVAYQEFRRRSIDTKAFSNLKKEK